MKNALIRRARWALVFLSALILLGCGASPSLSLRRDGGGRFDFTLRLEKPFVDYLLDLGEAAGLIKEREKAMVFDLKTIEKKLTRFPGVKIASLKATPAGELALSFTFKDVSVFAKPSELWPRGGLLTVTAGERKSLRLRLDRETVDQLITGSLSFKSDELEPFFPKKGETKESYYENLDFALENGAALFRQSKITFLVSVEGTILEHNGTLKTPSTVAFSVPLETLFFLQEPLEYFIAYR